jgi:hypothetical protein
MTQADSLFVGFRNPMLVPAMRRVFNDTSAAVRAWGACDSIFGEDEAEATIAQEILALAEDGVTDAETLASRALTRIGAEALDKVAQNIRPHGPAGRGRFDA